MTVDEESPYPTVDVIAAVVREYRVHPTWLLTSVSRSVGDQFLRSLRDTSFAGDSILILRPLRYMLSHKLIAMIACSATPGCWRRCWGEFGFTLGDSL